MRIAEAKRIPIIEILASQNFHPHHISNGSAWYLSPFRTEKTPSFKVDIQKNVWFDHGAGEGGDAVNIVQMLFNEPNIKRALAMMHNYASLALNPSVAIPAQRQKTLETVINSVREVEHIALVNFLKITRGITPDRAKRYLSEIHYQRGDSSYFALSHPNESGGFEVKSAVFEGSVNKKDISFIEGAEQGGRVAVFEGMFDFLALLELHNIDTPPCDVIILNSLNLLNKGAELVAAKQYNEVSLYFDNDSAGQKGIQDFKSHFAESELTLSDKSPSYAPHKDINDFLLEKRKKQIALDITISKQDPFTLGKSLELNPSFHEK